MNWPTWDQIKGIAERLITMGITSLLSLAVLRGWITKQQAIDYGAEIVPLVVAAVAAYYAYRRNRPESLATRTVNSSPGTVIVTTPEIARATPKEPNIVSATTNKVEPKTEEEITRTLNMEEAARHQ